MLGREKDLEREALLPLFYKKPSIRSFLCLQNSPSRSSSSLVTAMVIEDPTTIKSSLLLEYAAANDLPSFKNAVEVDDTPIDSTAPWYGRLLNSSRFAVADRTPLMIAALYGSVDVIGYIVDQHHRNPTIRFDRRSETDGATALLLASAGCSPGSDDAVRLLLSVSGSPADADAVKEAAKKRRKEYPVRCLALPDIKSGIYGSDEFRMYSFKVKPCSRAYPHDWTECPFAHPGENARRRDPRMYAYSCVPCPEFRRGSCRNGDGCEYAHGVFESWLHPMQYRTRLCKDEVGCNRRVCFFAHKVEELRTVNPIDGCTGFHNSVPNSLSPPPPGAFWMNLQAPPPSGVNHGRLKAWDAEFQMLVQQQKLVEQLQSDAAASPRGGNSSILRLHFPNQGLTQPLISPTSSPVLNSPSASFGANNSMAEAIMNASRSAAFAKRSQSFVDRGAVARAPATARTMGITSSWVSPDGKLDWGIQAEELNKFRKSASFAMGSSSRNVCEEEPDLSWVQSLVRDGREEQMVA